MCKIVYSSLSSACYQWWKHSSHSACPLALSGATLSRTTQYFSCLQPCVGSRHRSIIEHARSVRFAVMRCARRRVALPQQKRYAVSQLGRTYVIIDSETSAIWFSDVLVSSYTAHSSPSRITDRVSSGHGAGGRSSTWRAKLDSDKPSNMRAA